MHAFMELLIIGLVSVQVSVLITRNKPWGKGGNLQLIFWIENRRKALKNFLVAPNFLGRGDVAEKCFLSTC